MNRGMLVAAAIVLVAGLDVAVGVSRAPAATVPFPDPPAQAVAPHGTQVAVFAGGCFWGMEGVFEHVRGVKAVTAGYAGGTAATANYETVSSESTNHAESIRIEFDPAVVSYGRLLEVYFAVAHDPTQVNGQYPDEGRSYRSVIFPQSPAQADLARQYVAALNHAHAFKAPIATQIETGRFYPAEEYHQQFMRRHPDHPYIRRWDVERVEHLHSQFPQFYK
jgi:peptide-methionine (S)-S-oxide reductase